MNYKVFKKKKNRIEEKREKIRIGMILFMVVLLGIIIGIGIKSVSNKRKIDFDKEERIVDSVISFDVNPSVEIEADKQDRVLNTKALNEEGKKLLKDLKLVNMEIDDAIELIIKAMINQGYISDVSNSVLVSVKNNSDVKSMKLQKEISEDIEDTLEDNNIKGAVLVQVYKNDEGDENLANSSNISEGKAALIKDIVRNKIKDAKENVISEKQLTQMSINELKLLLESKKVELRNVISKGTASNKSYIGEDKAKEIVLNDSKVLKDNVKNMLVDMDYDDGLMVYDIEFRVDNAEYEYEINAKSGDIVNKEVDREDNLEDRDEYINETNYEEYKDNVNNNINNTSNKKNKSKGNSNDVKQSDNKPNVVSNNIPDKEGNKGNTSSYITKDKAKNIAYNNSGVQVNNVYDTNVEFDKDDGKAVYEVDFKSGRNEYEYVIDAISGVILEKDVEQD